MINSVFTTLTVLFLMIISASFAAADDDRDNHRNYHRENHYYSYQYLSSNYGWRTSYNDDPYEYYLPLSREELIFQINSQGFYWVYNIRPSHRNNYLTAIAYNSPYGGRSAFIRINRYTGRIFYIRYN